MNKVGFITFEKAGNRAYDSIGSSRIRARWLWEIWNGAEEYMIGGKYDVLIFQKAWWELMIEKYEGIKIFDICDPDWLGRKDPYFGLMSACDAVVTSTPALAEYIEKIIQHIPVICIPDRVNLKEHKRLKTVHSEKAKRVVWYGYSQNFHYIHRTLDTLKELGLELTIISNQSMQVSAEYSGLSVRNVRYNQETIDRDICENDIAILPETVMQDFKGKFKSNNKTIIAWAMGMPVARTPEELKKLMSQEARIKETDRRRKEVEEKWDVELSVKEYKELIRGIQNKKKQGN